EQVISKVLPLSRINDAIELTRTVEALKVVLVPDGKESEHHGK
ncbi:oxidoreductase, partial [Xanthomonas citri pv. citri]|nr:oxidoreductase [Xanthomonas citri pv. citri]